MMIAQIIFLIYSLNPSDLPSAPSVPPSYQIIVTSMEHYESYIIIRYFNTNLKWYRTTYWYENHKIFGQDRIRVGNTFRVDYVRNTQEPFYIPQYTPLSDKFSDLECQIAQEEFVWQIAKYNPNYLSDNSFSLIERLQSSRYNIREIAQQELEEITHNKLSLLIFCLHHKSSEVRMRANKILTKLYIEIEEEALKDLPEDVQTYDEEDLEF